MSSRFTDQIQLLSRLNILSLELSPFGKIQYSDDLFLLSSKIMTKRFWMDLNGHYKDQVPFLGPFSV